MHRALGRSRSVFGGALLLCAPLPACDPAEECHRVLRCNLGGTVDRCADAKGHLYYVGSDGTKFPCANSQDCNEASDKALAWCTTH